MKQEDKELLLKDLCARLPYGVLVVIQDTFKYSIVSREYHVLDVSNFSDIVSFNYKKFDKRMKKAMRERPNDIVIKPYLFPMSSMTEEQAIELFNIFGISLVDSIGANYIKVNEITGITFFFQNGFDVETHLDKLIDWLHKNHFDYRGLIPMGLAEDATDKNIY